jgi:hypothetical protein
LAGFDDLLFSIRAHHYHLTPATANNPKNILSINPISLSLIPKNKLSEYNRPWIRNWNSRMKRKFRPAGDKKKMNEFLPTGRQTETSRCVLVSQGVNWSVNDHTHTHTHIHTHTRLFLELWQAEEKSKGECH